MYGVVITSRPTNQVAETIEHIDGLPTRRAADDFAYKWCQEAPSNRTAFVYEMEKPAPKEPPLFSYSTGPAGATINLSQEQFSTKLKQLCYHLDYLKDSLCADATATGQQVENATIAHYIVHELEDALPAAQEDPNA
jgi:hypothetical protein